jgi:predicted transcriptional regulator
MHYNELKKNLKLNNGALSYHLQVLEREGYIKSLNSGRYKYFFPGKVALPKKFFKMNQTQKIIFNRIYETSGLTQMEISKDTGIATSTINYNITILKEHGVVKSERKGRETKWYLNQENQTPDETKNN